MHIQLQPGTILDERYRIDAVLGQGGFGITYAAENIRVGLKVAIKELFWKGHCLRPDQTSQEIALDDATDAQLFEEQKQRFLREARTIRDFSGQAVVVGILDYFEANNTAYIVMEFVEGETLAARFAEGPMACEELLRRFLPIIDTLDIIHRAGVIHRDISPDNIMIQSDGSLKLIDFGAARQYQSDESHYTAISKNSYSPCEQYDRNGHQGPWTDVYALCATLYACVCGTPPQGALQRMFLDELKAPSQLGVSITPAYESIIMRGLQLRTEKRWQSMDELAKAIRAALPKEKPASNNRRGVVIGLLAGLLCVALALGVWGWRHYDETHKFRGIETEQIQFSATNDTTATEFAAAQVELRKRLDDFAGKDNYLLTVDGDSMTLILPLSVFDNREIWDVIKEHFSNLVPEKGTNIWYEKKANWEDPVYSMFAGKNQVKPEALEGPTLVFRYDWEDDFLQSTPLTLGQRANAILDFKQRIDSLGVPYAFGTAYGNDNSIMVRMNLDRIGNPIFDTIGEEYQPLAFDAMPYNSFFGGLNIGFDFVMELIEEEDTTTGLLFSAKYNDDIEKLKNYTQAMIEQGLDKIYLIDKESTPIAYSVISEPIIDGKLAFRDFCLEGISTIGDDTRWLLEYYNTLINNTRLPYKCTMNDWQYIDADGNPPPKGFEWVYGLNYAVQNTCPALREDLCALEKEYGFTLKEKSGSFGLLFGLPLDDNLPTAIAEKLPQLLEAIEVNNQILPKYIDIIFTDENDDGKYISLRCRFTLSTSYDITDCCFKNTCRMVVWGKDIEPWRERIRRWWWDEFDGTPYKLEKAEFDLDDPLFDAAKR